MLQPVNLLKPVWVAYPEKRKLVQDMKCPECQKEIKENDFTDELSKKEYSISGLCQTCQNSVFIFKSV